MIYCCYLQDLVDCSSSHQLKIGCSMPVDQWRTRWRCSDVGHREVSEKIPCNPHRDGSFCTHEFWFDQDNLGSRTSLYQRIDDGRCRDIRAWWLLVNWLVNPGKKKRPSECFSYFDNYKKVLFRKDCYSNNVYWHTCLPRGRGGGCWLIGRRSWRNCSIKFSLGLRLVGIMGIRGSLCLYYCWWELKYLKHH